MKPTFIFITAISMAGLFSCNASQQKAAGHVPTETVAVIHPEEPQAGPMPAPVPNKTYSNERFRNVSVKEVLEGRYTIQGEAQVFEAHFNWVIEDGHKELKSGYAMTDAGAPEWGSFKFTLDVNKPLANSTLHIILFEASAKDGSRKFEVPVPLESAK